MSGTQFQLAMMWDMIVAIWCNFKKLTGMKIRVYDYEFVPVPAEDDEDPETRGPQRLTMWW